ncbi:MAG: tryptophan--tRNA ligase [Aureispira sp.]|nr:tryptophan--tRNA ligase [Aureispira sp.]
MSAKKRVLSAIQPTGEIHFGNYFGAVQNWVKLQEDYDCVYGVVDYHAMTMPFQPNKLRENTWSLMFNLVALGVKPENLFIQSLVPEHAELNWIFNCFCSYGRLQLMTQFKDKSQQSETKSDGFISVGLFDYPVLQAADILIYKADFVPVGKDQDQHLELTRMIANRFNLQVDKDYFVLPKTLHSDAPKIRSLADPTRKMSKSAGEKHYLSVFEEEKRLRKKVMSAVTDSGEMIGTEEMSEGVKNLFTIIKACGHTDVHDDFMTRYKDGSIRYGDFKGAAYEALLSLNSKFRENKEEVMANKKEIKYQIKNSSAEIRKIAQQTIKEVKDLTGLMNVKF